MIIFPAIDILEGNTVKLVQGVRGTGGTVSLDPVELAQKWIDRGTEELHVIDLSGAFGDGDNRNVIAKILEISTVPVQVGGGIRSGDAVNFYLDKGATRVIVGTRGVKEPGWLGSQALRHPGKVMLAVDADGVNVVVKGWVEQANVTVMELTDHTKELPLAGLLYTNVRVEGLNRGVDWKPVDQVLKATDHPLILAGGVTTVNDVQDAKKRGIYGAVIGSAFYAGKLHFEDALKAAKG